MSTPRITRAGATACLLWAVACCVGAATGRGDAIPAAIFGDHMVLQRDRPVTIWGTGRPGEAVDVRFGDTAGDTRVDDEGRWRLELPPLRATSEPRPFVIRGDRERRIEDVLVGDVWLCAGQSNMLFPLVRAGAAEREVAAADVPRLRLCHCDTAAGGDSPPYTASQIERLTADGFMSPAWARCGPDAARGFSAVAFFFGRTLARDLDLPVGVICLAVGGAPTEAWIDRSSLAADAALRGFAESPWLTNPLVGEWCRTRARQNLVPTLAAGGAIPGDEVGPAHPFKPGFLWEAGIGRIAPFPIRGVAWYQGESNAESAELVALHERLLPALVASWRAAWSQPELPFGIVQLPGMNRPHWPAFRESQRRLHGQLDHAGLIVTIDLGRPDDVHPPDKQPVGERLAAWAAAVTRGESAAAGSGPLPLNAAFRADGTVVVRFEHAEELTTRDGGPPRLFELGRDGLFHAALARIDGDAVIVEAARGAGPWTEVRYAWVPFPGEAANLTDQAGRPASPFRLARDQ